MAEKIGGGLGQGASLVESSERLVSLPETTEALRRGELSGAQVKEITATAIRNPRAESDLLAAAKNQGLKGLKEECLRVKARALSEKDAREKYEEIRKNRSLHMWTDQDGVGRLDARLALDDFARVFSAIGLESNAVFAEARKAGHRESGAAYAADALVALVTGTSVSSSDTPREPAGPAKGANSTKGARSTKAGRRRASGRATTMHLRVDLAALQRGELEGNEVCEIPGIGPVPLATARNVLGESILKVIIGNGVDVTSVCHLGRAVPAHIRSALEDRDAKCVVPGSAVAKGLEIDHYQIALEKDGPTELWNLCRLCHWRFQGVRATPRSAGNASLPRPRRPTLHKHVMTREHKQMARSLKAKGLNVKEIARAVDIHFHMAHLTVYKEQPRTRKSLGWVPAPGRLSAEEREDILIGLSKHESMSSIARRLGRAPSTVTREVAANGGVEHYGAWRGHCRAREAARRPKPCKLDNRSLVAQVSTWLQELWSPQQISARLRLDYPDDPMMRVSYETIYQSLYVQGRGELRRELARCLRSGNTKRHHQGGTHRLGKVRDMVMVSDRPAEVDDRAVPGHWEGDLIIGGGGNRDSAVGTLVERTTRLVLLLHLPGDRRAKTVEQAMKKAIATLPAELARSVTWDQGIEMANHKSFTVATGVPVYFCNPRSPWQRGTNENTNGLLRQYMPKGSDLSIYSARDLKRIQRSLNNRPRKTLGYMTPSEKFAEFVALTP